MRHSSVALVLALLASNPLAAQDGNRLAYLDGADPYYVSRTFPKLVTPQWVGEEGVEAVVIISIDDMRLGGTKNYENHLRPALRRLQKFQGNSATSIMTCQADPKDPQLQAWLKEGVSIETHTWDHPCPLLSGGDFAKAAGTFGKSVDVLSMVPGHRPVAFRMPCCDSLNTQSPRFLTEIFNKTTAAGNFLHIDSSVFNLFTPNDPELPRELVMENGQERFRKYGGPALFNTIDDYPYPYVIDRLCWEVPCTTPSDWQAQNLLKEKNSPRVLRDWKAGLDATVIKQGVFCLVIHPWGWSSPDQLADLVDYAAEKYGKKVKFLSFKEVLERLNRHLLTGQSLRAADGGDNGVRLIDVNHDGFMDVIIANDKLRQTRIWSPGERRWIITDFPVPLVRDGKSSGGQFGILHADQFPTLLVRNEVDAGAWHFNGKTWNAQRGLLDGLEIQGKPVMTVSKGINRGVRLLDLDGDGLCELIVGNAEENAAFTWSKDKRQWQALPFALPAGTSIVDAEGRDNGLRFLDLDEDGFLDVYFSNEERSSLHLFDTRSKGWSVEVASGKRGGKNDLPMAARKGTNNGLWFHSRRICVQNENVQRFESRAINDVLAAVEARPRSPEASRKSIQVHAGFRVELVAAEPLVQSPIGFAWGADGKLWVVEMGDYPLGLDGKGKPGGRVKYLEDTTGTGKYDKATIFLDNLSYPTSVLPWRKGVIVTAAPEIFYAEDTKGTGKADLRVPLCTGFNPGNPQHRVNSLTWGLDNWLYCANGDSGGDVTAVKSGKKVNIRGRDFRIRPDDNDIDLQTGQTQYMRTRDDWNHWFGNNNSNPMWHMVLADHYLRRNPALAVPNPRQNVSVAPGASAVYPISRTLPRFNSPQSANHFTSACSAIVYRDDLFGPDFSRSTFVSEPVHNLVHREVLESDGCTFSSRRAPDGTQSEFLASSDNWFRPTMIATGPDGAIWIADMYRAVIEHPEWIPKDWQQRIDLRAGQDRGRIYRVVPVGVQPRTPARLDKLDTAGLVAALDSPNGWQRDTAQQMLLWKDDRAAVPLLADLAVKCPRPLGRVHALCTLEGLRALTAEQVRRALDDPHPGVREQAVRLSEGLLAKHPELGDDLFKLTADPSAPVRLQLACTLGELPGSKSGKALAVLAMKDSADRFITAGVLSSIHADNLDAMLREVLVQSTKGPPTALIEELLRIASALKQTKAMATLFTAIGTPEKGEYALWQYRALAGLLDFLDKRNTPLVKLQSEGEHLKSAVKQLDGLFAKARGLAADVSADRDLRLAALALLGRGLDRQAEDYKLLAGMLVPQTPGDLQSAAIAALGHGSDPSVAALLLRGWKGYSPALKNQVFDVLFSRKDWLNSALAAIERKEIRADLDAARRQTLLQHADAKIRERARKIFAGAVSADRQKVLAAYQDVLKTPGDATRGNMIFAKNCAQCHRLGKTGNAVGPDVESIGDRSPQGLLIAILDPNRVVEARYVNYTAVTKNGLTLNGLLASEAGNSITLLAAEAKQQVILRADLEELFSTGKSVMPEGLEKDIDVQAMADLIAFLRSAAPPPAPKAKVFDGNRPETIVPSSDGVLLLSAKTAEVSGKTLIFEKKNSALEYWGSEDDTARWTVNLPKAGRFEVWLEWSCPDKNAVNRYQLQAGERTLTGKVMGTKTWENYQTIWIGDIELSAGQQTMVFRSAGKIDGYLLDFRYLKLVPKR